MPRNVVAILLAFMLFPGVSGAEIDQNLFSFPAAKEPAAAQFKKVVELLGSVARVEADFTERKEMHLVNQPLLSSGRIVFSPADGLYRKMDRPFEMEILINQKEFIQRTADGEVVRTRVGKIAPAKAFIELFLSVLGGDERRWEKHFDVFFLGTTDQWQMGFRVKPKSPVARGLRQILITGEGPKFTAVQTIEKNGDLTTTRYSNHHVLFKGDGDLATQTPFPDFSSKP